MTASPAAASVVDMNSAANTTAETATTEEIRAMDVKPGDIVIINGREAEVTFARKSKYSGYRELQHRPRGTTGHDKIEGYTMRWADKLPLVARRT